MEGTFMNENYYGNNYDNNDSRTEKMALTMALAISAVILFIIILICGKCVSTYNHLVDMQEEVELAEANVETMMQRRLELIPDLVSTVKAYTKHEEQVYADIAAARESLGNSFNTGDPEQISEANENLTIAVNSLLALAENYPELTAGEQYTSLMDQLEGSVNRISIAREEYNEKISEYNKTVRHFPGNILAGMFGFDEMEEFKADEAANNPNMVNFDD